MKWHLPGLMLAMLWTFTVMPASAQEEPRQRLCTEKDVPGTYSLVKFHEAVEDGEFIQYQNMPHQYVAFYPEHIFGMLIINKNVTTAAVLNRYILPKGVKNKSQKYQIPQDGLLIMYKRDKILYSYRCIVSRVDNEDYKKGDLLLIRYANKTTNEISLLYRRWK